MASRSLFIIADPSLMESNLSEDPVDELKNQYQGAGDQHRYPQEGHKRSDGPDAQNECGQGEF
jgi:hypothetical protein